MARQYSTLRSPHNLPHRVWYQLPNGKWASRQWRKNEPQEHMAAVWPQRTLVNLEQLDVDKGRR